VAVGVLEVVDELGEILDGVDVVVRRRRDEADTRGRVAGLGDPRVDLATGELAAFAGLGALGHLDLELAGAGQVLAGHAEAAGGDLLDGGVLGVALLVGPGEARRILAAFAGVGLAADAVHGDGERLVRLLRDGAVGHGARLETLHNLFGRLDLLEGDRRAGLELEQAAQRAEVLPLVVDDLRVALEGRVAAGARGLLQEVDGLGREQVGLAIDAPLVDAADGQHVTVDLTLGIRGVVAGEDLLGDDVEADAADARGGPGEVVIDHVLAQAERLEDLSAAVALDGGDAHLGHDLHDALGGGLHVVLAGGLVVDAGEHALVDHVVDRLEDDVRVDHAHAVADEQREVVHLAGLAGLEHETGAGAQTLADEIVMQAGDGQQRGDGGEVRADAAVAEDEDVDLLLLDHAAGDHADLLHGLGQAALAAGDTEEGGEDANLETGLVEAADLGEFLVGEDGPLDLDAAAGRGLRVQQIALGAEAGLGGDDDLLADGVDRRVGDLREELLEVIVEETRLVGQHREGAVVAHGADGLDAVARHRGDDDALVLVGVAEGDLALEQRLVVRRRDGRSLGQVLEVEMMLGEPIGVRALVGELPLDLLVLDDATLDGVDEEEAAGLEAALTDDVGGGNVEHARLRGHDDEAVLGHAEARRAQAVAVEDGADLPAVGEGDGGRAVPRLHQAGVELVEGAAGRVHLGITRPRFRDHHHDRVRQRAAGEDEELERVVEHRRVAAVRVHDREDLADILAEGVGVEERLAGVHPVDVAAERVDLAVVRDVAVRMRAVPAREGVRAEARVHEADRGLHRGVGQVGEVLRELVGKQHALVHERAAREAGDVPLLGTGHGGGADLGVAALADEVELALEGDLVGHAVAAADEDLAHERLAGLGGLAERRVVGRHGAPAQKVLALRLDDALEGLLDLAADGRVAREEDDAAAVLAGGGEGEPRFLGRLLQELMRHLHEHARAIARVGLAAGSAAVVEVRQDLQRLLQDLVRFAPVHVRHETDAAGIVLEGRIIQALLGGPLVELRREGGLAGHGWGRGRWFGKS